jgi:hypothetical protein
MADTNEGGVKMKDALLLLFIAAMGAVILTMVGLSVLALVSVL